MKQDGFTPREMAYSKTIDAVRVQYNYLKENRDGYPQSYLNSLLNGIARIHNSLLEKSGLDGLGIDLIH